MFTTDVIQKNIYADLQNETALNTSNISVSVADDGVASLRGTIPKYTDKWAAKMVTARVAGVRFVMEDLRVKLPRNQLFDDRDLEESVSRALLSNRWVPEQVRATVINGWVTLTGAVHWDFEKRSAVEAVQKLSGVCGIDNLITVDSVVKSQDVRLKIKSALERMADLDIKNICIQTSGGRVTLTGRVHSYSEKEEARTAAWRTPGVVSVTNNLRVAI
jgi:osmotically-inducible protein OsmY